MRRIAVLAALVTAALACGPAVGQQQTTNLGEVKLGALFPLSGTNASSGQDALRGVELAVDVLNGKYAKVDLPQLTVGKVKLVTADTQGDAQVGSADVDRLVNTDKVAAITGAFQSAVTITASQRAERLGMPFVNGSSSSPALTERGFQWFYRVGPSDRTYAETYFKWLKSIDSQYPVRKVVTFHGNETFGNDGAKVVQELAPKYGVQVLEDVAYPTDATDLTSQVQRIRSQAPDAVFVFSFLAPATLVVKTMAQLAYTPPALLTFDAGFVDPQFVPTLGSKAYYSITRAAWALEIAQKNPTARAVAEAFRQRYGQDMTETSARDFMATITIGAAIESARSTDPTKIRDALKKTNLTKTIMPWKAVKFDAKGQNELAEGLIEQMGSDGLYHVLYPAEVATTKVTWPLPPLHTR